MSFSDAVLTEFRKRLAAERQKTVDTLISGRLEDYSFYRYSCGYIKALDDIEVILEEINTDLRKG